MLRSAIDLLRRANGGTVGMRRSSGGTVGTGPPVRVAQLRNTGFLRLDLRVSGGADPRGDGERGPCLAWPHG
jgi:hypothetical protein